MRVRLFMVLLGLLGLLAFWGAGSVAAAPGSSVLLDCNGYGAANNPDHPAWRCPDVRGASADEPRFEDNGHYIGHDEPSIEFFSTTPGSGNSARYDLVLPTDPSKRPDGSVSGPVWNFQTHVAFWFGMTMCDTQSFPETTTVCQPDSDSNLVPRHPVAMQAGSAYMELQFYPPGWSPQISCDQKHWCAALTITSLQETYKGVANENCIEPQAFAFVTKSGHPVGPTGPDNATDQSFTPTSDVLLMNPTDRVTVSMYDTTGGFQVRLEDQTTHQTGTMTAAASNGWRHIVWDPVNFTCQGEPYTFHPMFSTAAPPYPNGQPRAWPIWTEHTYNVAMSDEIGHFENPDAAADPGGEEEPCFSGPIIPGCLNSDLDFDGASYQADWPDGSAQHPGPVIFSTPKVQDSQGNWVDAMTRIRFETNLPGIQPLATCDFQGNGCTNPPPGASFYPWFHSLPSSGSCAWTLSNDLPGQLSNFGGEQAAWGPIESTDYGAGFVAVLNFASSVLDNPCPG